MSTNTPSPARRLLLTAGTALAALSLAACGSAATPESAPAEPGATTPATVTAAPTEIPTAPAEDDAETTAGTNTSDAPSSSPAPTSAPTPPAPSPSPAAPSDESPAVPSDTAPAAPDAPASAPTPPAEDRDSADAAPAAAEAPSGPSVGDPDLIAEAPYGEISQAITFPVEQWDPAIEAAADLPAAELAAQIQRFAPAAMGVGPRLTCSTPLVLNSQEPALCGGSKGTLYAYAVESGNLEHGTRYSVLLTPTPLSTSLADRVAGRHQFVAVGSDQDFYLGFMDPGILSDDAARTTLMQEALDSSQNGAVTLTDTAWAEVQDSTDWLVGRGTLDGVPVRVSMTLTTAGGEAQRVLIIERIYA